MTIINNIFQDISNDQRKKKLLDVKRFEKEHGILKNIQEKSKLTAKQIENLEDKFLSKYRLGLVSQNFKK